MRYLIDSRFQNEIKARQKYIYDTLKVWTLPKESTHNGFVVLEGLLPTGSLDCCFIIGHNIKVKKYLLENHIYETVIVAITCDGLAQISNIKLKRKNLYIPTQDSSNLAPLYHGQVYGFDFDLTESEILFATSNPNDSVIRRIENSFCRVEKGRIAYGKGIK